MKIKYYILFLLIISETALASKGIFSVSCSTDLSARFLSHIFGSDLLSGICSPADSKSMLGMIFRVFNNGLVVFAGGFISYAAVSSVLTKASDGGQAAGGGGSNPWMPVRLVTGASLLIPLKSGYSMIQIIVMWAVIQGIGMANSIWTKQLEMLEGFGVNTDGKIMNITQSKTIKNKVGGALYSLKLKPDSVYSTPSIYSTGVCLAVLEQANKAAQEFDKTVKTITYGITNDCGEQYNKRYGDRVFCAGSINSSKQRTACGVYLFGKKNAISYQVPSNKYRRYVELKKTIIDKVGEAKMQASLMLENKGAYNSGVRDCDAPNSSCKILKSINTGLASAVDSIIRIDRESDMITLVDFSRGGGASVIPSTIRFKNPYKNPNKTSTSKSDKQEWLDQSKKMGWISAGQNYYKFSNQSSSAKSDYEYADIDKTLPIVFQGFTVQDSNSNSGTSEYLDGEKLDNYFGKNIERGAFSTLVSNFREVLLQNSVMNSVNENAKEVQDTFSLKNKENEVTKGAIKLKNLLVKAYISKPKEVYTTANSTFNVSSFMHTESGKKIFLTAPLDNMLVLMGLVTGDLTGVNLRLDSWVTDLDSAYYFNTKKESEKYGVCKDSNDLPDACLKKNVGIIGYLYSYYDKGDDKGQNVAKTIDPLTNLTHIGHSMLKYSMKYWVNTIKAMYDITQSLVWRYSVTKAATSFIGGLIPGIGGAISSLGGMFDIFYNMDMFNMGIYLPMGVAISGLFFVMGVTLGIYLPIIPFMIFTFTAVGWILAVVEAIIAAPLVALGVTHPQGHDLLGKAEQSVILLMGIFVRPAAIILGFIISIALLKEVLMLVNTGFLSLLTQLYENGLSGVATDTIGLNVLVIGVLMVYVYIILAVVNQSFSLIYQVPEKLMRWIGAAPENTGVMQMAGEVKQGVQSGGQALSQGGQQTAQQKPQIETLDTSEIYESTKDARKTSSESKEHGS